MTPPPRHVLVVGAGLAGLSAAWRLSRAGSRVTVLERAARAGGRFAGERVDGYSLPAAPLLVTSGDRRLLAWIEEIGLRDELLPPRPVVTGFHDGHETRDIQLRALRDVARLPGVKRLHALRLVRLPRLLARYGSAVELGAAAEAEWLDDRSLADFARLYFGASVLDHWMAPLSNAACLGDAEETSRALFLQLQRARAFASPGTLRGTLDDVFERAAQLQEVVTGCPVSRLEAGSDGGFRALTDDGRSFAGDALVLATHAPQAARLADPFLSTPERHFLANVRYAPSLTVAAALCRPPTPRPRHVWVSPVAGSPLAHALFEPGLRGGAIPADGGSAVLRATGRFAADHLETPSETLDKEMLAAADVLVPGVARGVEFTRVFRHRFGAPRFDVGSYRAIARFRRVQADRRAAGRRIAFAGDYLVAPTTEGAVRAGERAAAALLGGDEV